MEQNNTMNLRQKLLEIQKKFHTFAVENESAKTDAKNKPAYKYAPGWKIVESVRSEMDAMGIMLDLDIIDETDIPITYPVFKEIGGKIMQFNKTEVLTKLYGEFTFVDVATGETVGPRRMSATGANGTDKSCASAYSLLEKYFILKQFHITTRETDDEPDAHDDTVIRGLEGLKVPTHAAYGREMTTPDTVAQQTTNRQPAPATPRYNQQNSQSAVPSSQAAAQWAAKYANNAEVNGVIAKLSNFQKGTSTALNELKQALSYLNANGYTCAMNPDFIDFITESAQARREGRNPAFV